jgi:hypothetical protein
VTLKPQWLIPRPAACDLFQNLFLICTHFKSKYLLQSQCWLRLPDKSTAAAAAAAADWDLLWVVQDAACSESWTDAVVILTLLDARSHVASITLCCCTRGQQQAGVAVLVYCILMIVQRLSTDQLMNQAIKSSGIS